MIMWHQWQTTNEGETDFSESCLACSVTVDIPNARAGSFVIPIGDIRSVIPNCPGPAEPLPLPDDAEPVRWNTVREYPEPHHWYVSGSDRFRDEESGRFTGGQCDRVACHWCSSTMDLHTRPSTVPTYCTERD